MTGGWAPNKFSKSRKSQGSDLSFYFRVDPSKTPWAGRRLGWVGRFEQRIRKAVKKWTSTQNRPK